MTEISKKAISQKKLDNWLIKVAKPSVKINADFRKGSCRGCDSPLLFGRDDWLKKCEKCGKETLDEIRHEFIYVRSPKPCNKVHRIWGLRTWFLCQCCDKEYVIGKSVREIYGQMVYTSTPRQKGPKLQNLETKNTSQEKNLRLNPFSVILVLASLFVICARFILCNI